MVKKMTDSQQTMYRECIAEICRTLLDTFFKMRANPELMGLVCSKSELIGRETSLPTNAEDFARMARSFSLARLGLADLDDSAKTLLTENLLKTVVTVLHFYSSHSKVFKNAKQIIDTKTIKFNNTVEAIIYVVLQETDQTLATYFISRLNS